ncbi:MAG: TonB-dependent receptor domain-containing protein, partial [Flavobacteriales bacterium]
LSIGANWAVSDSTRLRFSLATAYRPPHVSELFSEGLHHGAAAIEEGDAGLGSERALKAAVDLEAGALQGRLRIEATVHASRINGYIYLRPDGTRLTIRGAFPVFRYVATDALMGGADARAVLRISARLAWAMSGSTVLARDMRRSEWLFLMPADRLQNELMARWPQAGPWRSIELSASSLLVARQRRAPEGLDFAPPPCGYHLLGLSAAASLPLGANTLRIGLQASNLLNTAFRDYLDRFRYYADSRGMDILINLRYAFGQRA